MIKFLIEKEFKQIVRNPFLPKLILMMPVLMLLIMPWAANQEVKNIKLAVVDNDHSSYSRQLIAKAAASTWFHLTQAAASHAGAMEGIESGDADIILEIAPDFEKNLMTGRNAAVMISANSVNGTKGGLGSAYLGAIVRDFSDDLHAEQGLQTGNMIVPAIQIIPRYEFNPHLDYKVFMVPALMVMLITLLSGFLPALNIVGEKEAGTIEQINVTPVGKFTFIVAKLIPYWIVGFIVLSVGFGIAALVYGLFPAGSIATIYLYATVYILVVSGMGLVVSNYSDTMQQAMFVMFFFIMVLILMSGLFTPIASMPRWAQMITTINPLRYFMEVMRAVYLKGSGVGELLPQLAALSGFAFAFNLWAVLSYRKSS